ncbi:MAG: DUF1080 domain-containing protein [Lentisphaerales bacterium]|nr:DUF1080 domain-containing protein [Lentisphaerales bacterium]
MEKDFKHWKIFKPVEDFEKPFGEWNTVFVIKIGKILQLFMNQKKIGNVIIDFLKESPIGFSFLHPCDVEFRSIYVTEIKE